MKIGNGKNPAAMALGKLGGLANVERHGHDHFVRIGKMGGAVNKLLRRLGQVEVQRRVRKEGACPLCGFPPSLHGEVLCGKDPA